MCQQNAHGTVADVSERENRLPRALGKARNCCCRFRHVYLSSIAPQVGHLALVLGAAGS